MSIFIVRGGVPLRGEVCVHGAKNSVLPLLAACILSGGVCTLHNCPDLSDVRAARAILEHLGCKTRTEGSSITVDATEITRCDIPDELMRAMRSSVIFLGAVLARTGCASLNFPGGCELGPRPIDLHLASLRQLGAEITEGASGLRCAAPSLTGCEITLSIPSVGATENAMLAAVGAAGVTTIINAAREPEIVDLQRFLNAIGGNVRGAGSSVITILGGLPLHGGEHRVIGDRIVAATFLSMAAATGGEILTSGVDYKHLSTVTCALAEAGCAVRSTRDSISLVRAPDRPLRAVHPLRTAPYPGFPTDAQPPVMTVMALAQGVTLFVENIFDSRYRHVDELIRMGADIRTEGRVAVVSGVPALHGAAVQAADLRGGAALLCAALAAEGESVIAGLGHIDRGYAGLEEDVRRLGGQILRTEQPL